MRKIVSLATAVIGLAAFLTPVVFAYAASISVASLSPGQSVVARDRLTFGVAAVGFNPVSYQLTDSFPNSSVTITNLTASGSFFWVPVVSDVGTHIITITATDG